jgi:hypothetical protein
MLITIVNLRKKKDDFIGFKHGADDYLTNAEGP